MGYGYDDRFYDRGVSRNNSMDAASRVASEIFQHDLMGASRDTRQILSQTSSRDADAFVQQVNRKVEQMNQYYGQQDDGCTNFLSARHSYDRYGRPTERISMANSDGESRGIVDVPMQPYGRVPMNFSGYQPGEQPGAGYYDNQQAYNGFRPQPQVPYDGGYDQYQNYQQQAFYPQPQNYGYYRPQYQGYGYGYPHANGSLVAGLAIGSLIGRAFRI